jgi:GNAT superfamily N-acetyltransferase
MTKTETPTVTWEKTHTRAEPYSPEHLDALADLINLHIGAAVPGWWVTPSHLAAVLHRNRGQYIIDPWVADRATFVVGTPYRLRAAVHLLRYRDDPDVHPSSRGIGAIAWLAGRPDAPDALDAALHAAHGHFKTWGVTRSRGWDTGFPVPVLSGVVDAWPHLARALTAAGYTPGEVDESLYGGRLNNIPEPGDPPLPGLTVRRVAGDWSALFLAELDGEEIGRCEVTADLTRAGQLPGLRGWAELEEMNVEEPWRNRGVGTWLQRRAVTWLRLARCDRIALSVGADDEARGAGRFYQRFGWHPLVRETRSWTRAHT